MLCRIREATKPREASGESDDHSDGIGPHGSAEISFGKIKKHSVRTWRSAEFFICFLWESRSNSGSASSNIDTPQVEANAHLQIPTIEKFKALGYNQQGSKA